jgi:1-acyl-sn-glycerol-3-phosphate acyltransferase
MKFKPVAKLILWGFDLIYALVSRVELKGKENILMQGAVLVVTNHLSYADPPLIYITMRRPDMVVLAADTYKKNPLYKWLVDSVGGVWINRGSGDRAALKVTIDVLKQGKMIGMAPEGTRSKHTHALQVGKTGAAFLASKAGVPILPVGINGTEKAWEELKHLRRPVLTIAYGRPFTLPPIEHDAKETLEQYTHEIMCRIAALLPEEYHGVYKGEARIEELKGVKG